MGEEKEKDDANTHVQEGLVLCYHLGLSGCNLVTDGRMVGRCDGS